MELLKTAELHCFGGQYPQWGAGYSTSKGAADAELAHAGFQGGALHAEKIGGAARTGNVPLRLAEGAEDVLAFGFFQGGD
ncbi:MAG: hypothetical protein WCE53_15705 [Candidatus Acidiferrum sp.]